MFAHKKLLLLAVAAAAGVMLLLPVAAMAGTPSGGAPQQVSATVQSAATFTLSTPDASLGSGVAGQTLTACSTDNVSGGCTGMAGTYEVTTNDAAGYSVLLTAPTPDVFTGTAHNATFQADGNNGVLVAAYAANALASPVLTPIPATGSSTGGSVTLASQAGMSGPSGDLYLAGYQLTLPNVAADSYNATFTYTLFTG